MQHRWAVTRNSRAIRVALARLHELNGGAACTRWHTLAQRRWQPPSATALTHGTHTWVPRSNMGTAIYRRQSPQPTGKRGQLSRPRGSLRRVEHERVGHGHVT